MNINDNVYHESHGTLTATLAEFLRAQQGKVWIMDEPNAPSTPPTSGGPEQDLRRQPGADN